MVGRRCTGCTGEEDEGGKQWTKKNGRPYLRPRLSAGRRAKE